MKKLIYLLCFGALVSLFEQTTFAQCPPFIDVSHTVMPSYTALDLTYNIQNPSATVVYETVKRVWPLTGAAYGNAVSVKMDIYRPVKLVGKTSIQCPVVILCHGADRRRFSPEWQIRAQDFTRRGYVVVSLDYRADVAFNQLELLTIASQCNTASCKRKYIDRILYSNAMDVHNAISYLVANQTSLKINPNKIIIGGHSLGAATAFVSSCLDKNEVLAGTFPSNFLTNTFYINLATHRSRIKGAILWSPATTDVNYLDSSDNVPLFIFHGTHDPAAPFYSGKQLCNNLNPTFYGGAAIAVRADSFTTPYSYYFVEARGAGHSIGVSCQYLPFGDPNETLQMLWSPDLLRFMKTTMLEGTVNQVHKVVTPLNTSQYDYCTGVQNTYCNGDADEFVPTPSSIVACFQFPAFTLSTMPWNNGSNNYNSCTSPIVYPTPDGTCGGYGKVDMSSTFPSASLSLFPNPTRNNLNISYNSTANETATITLYDLSGKIALQTTETATEGTNNYNLQLAELSTGMYIVQVQTPTQQLTQKVQLIR